MRKKTNVLVQHSLKNSKVLPMSFDKEKSIDNGERNDSIDSFDKEAEQADNAGKRSFAKPKIILDTTGVN